MPWLIKARRNGNRRALAAGRGAVAGAWALAPAAFLFAATPALAATPAPVRPHSPAAARWSIETMVTPTGATQTYTFGVSCPSALACTAAADESTTTPGQYVTVAERWDGGGWVQQKTPNVPGVFGFSDTVSGVSCGTTSDCVLVGTYVTADDHAVALVERWNGSSWKVEDGPAPAGTDEVNLDGVACSRAGACTAVGLYNLGSGAVVPLAARSDGAGWQVQDARDPAGSDLAELHGVSCPAAKACMAVGTYRKGAGYYSVAYQWAGGSWNDEKPPNPPDSDDITFWSVSCPSSADCIAVGSDEVTTGTMAFAEHWNGKNWALDKMPAPSGSQGGSLASVDCVSVNDCVAVGEYYGRSAAEFPLIEQWNGRSWAVVPALVPPHATTSYLDGVSCAAATCVATGTYLAGAWHPFSEIER